MKREDVKNKIPGITDEQIVDARTQLSNTYVPTGGRPQGRTA